MSTPVDTRKPETDVQPQRRVVPQTTIDITASADPVDEALASSTPPDPALARTYAVWEIALAVFGVLLGTGVATIGLYSSFGALYNKAALPAEQGGWEWADPWMLPVGVDASILAFGIVNLLLIRAKKKLWWIKWVPRCGTAVTIYLNWEAAATIPAQVGHAALASLWVVFSEIAAHLYAAHIGEAEGVRNMDKIRLERWVLAPITTFLIWRLMRLDEITSYSQALALHKSWLVYKQRLAAKYGTRWWRYQASPEELAPFQLARVGLSVEEALAEPLLEEVREQQRQASAALQRAEAEIQKVDADVQIRNAQIQAEVRRIQSDGELQLAKTAAKQAARAEIQKAEADFQLAEAERQADLDLVQERTQARAQQLADDTEKRRTLARIEAEKTQTEWRIQQQRLVNEAREEERRMAVENERRAAQEQADLKAATARQARQAAEDSKATAKAAEEAAESLARAAERDAEAVKLEEEAQRSREEIAASKLREAQADEDAAERLARASEYQARASEALSWAKLTPAEWQAHRVAAMIHASGADSIKVDTVAEEFGVSVGTAHNRIMRAQELLATSQAQELLPAGM
ncbi:DUF2637 domain-containing protein [Streptomyces noursei]|uniref:DUF2637 domain-containing protein n=1 Tax=Streptomyces noursei TaxID=1971 RepID=UPI001675DA70|nr:DUF2637 domain-containing protein [Streptomyces noursei]MCZ1021319.1 DUF2637 domain-containing protein [Streptomyces noursei]GGX55816.1 hypothetical protein GCM10010341_90680 [Streptomyces noursei]